MNSDEFSPLRHPLSRKLLKLKILDRWPWELSGSEQRLRNEITTLCSEIHKHGWNAARIAAAQRLLKGSK